MSSLAKARTGTARAGRCIPAESADRTASPVKILLQTVARVAMFPFPLLLAGQPSAPGTGGGECLWLNVARLFPSIYFHRAQRIAVRFPYAISTARNFAERDGGLS